MVKIENANLRKAFQEPEEFYKNLSSFSSFI
jgi:hypothetical protein